MKAQGLIPRRARLTFHHPHGGLQPSVSPVPEGPIPISGVLKDKQFLLFKTYFYIQMMIKLNNGKYLECPLGSFRSCRVAYLGFGCFFGPRGCLMKAKCFSWLVLSNTYLVLFLCGDCLCWQALRQYLRATLLRLLTITRVVSNRWETLKCSTRM